MFDVLHRCVDIAQKLGAVSTSVRADNLTTTELGCERDGINDVKTFQRFGVGITVYYHGSSGYSFTTSNSVHATAKATREAFKIAKATQEASHLRLSLHFRETSSRVLNVRYRVRKHPCNYPLDYKMELLQRMLDSAEERGKSISSLAARYGETYGTKYFVNSAGTEISWQPLMLGISITTILKKTNCVVGSTDGYSGTVGLEAFDGGIHTPEQIGKNSAIWASEKLKTKTLPKGRYRALFDNQLVGILIHEAFGHFVEADSVLTGRSPFGDKLKQHLASKLITVVDCGTPEIEGGYWLPYDTQGAKTTRTMLMKRGKLVSYLHSLETASCMRTRTTGNARAVNLSFQPIVRMTNTYVLPGDLRVEEALEQVNSGIHAMSSPGGEVDANGNFRFRCSRAYWVEHGEVKHPLRNIVLSGNILSLLQNVVGASEDLEIISSYFGGCGKGDQFPLTVGYGGPKLLVDNVSFGGG